MRTVGHDNGTVLGLIAERRISRSELNRRVKAGEYRELHRGLIASAFNEAGL